MSARNPILPLLVILCLPVFAHAQESMDGHILAIPIDGAVTEKRSRQIVGQIHSIPEGVEKIIVVVDSEDGALPDFLAIADALSAAKVGTIAYVKNATGASVFIAASCDRIVSDRMGIIGGAGVVSRDFMVLSDSLFSAVRDELTARLVEYSNRKQHDSGVFAAMISPEHQLVRDGREWKQPGQILALTAREMIALRLAESEWSSVQAFIDASEAQPDDPDQRR